MEPTLATGMLLELKDKGCHVETIVMDDDTSTINRINQCFDEKNQKRSDKNHTRKNITNDLYKLKQSHPSAMSKPTIDYFVSFPFFFLFSFFFFQFLSFVLSFSFYLSFQIKISKSFDTGKSF